MRTDTFRRKIRAVTRGLAVGVGLAALATSATAQDGVITFGTALSLTGKMSPEGSLVKEGYDLYVKEINKRGGIKVGDKAYEVAIKYYDDQSDANTSVKLYEKLINEDGITLLLGPYSSGITFATSAVAEKYQLPMVAAHAAATATYERGFKFLFSTLTPVDQYTSNMIKMAANATPRAQRVALIHESSLFPQASIDAAERQAKEAGLDVVYKEAYPSGTKDFSSMLAAIKSKNPDLLLAAGYTGDMTVIARQRAEVGLDLKMFGVSLGPTLPGFVESLGEKAEGILEPIQWSSNMGWKDEIFGWTAAEYAELFEKEYGREPDYHPPQSTAALEVYQRAIERAGTLDPKAVRDEIAKTDLMTAYGPVRFNDKGQNVAKGMAVVQVQDGKPVVIYPPGSAQGEFIYPLK